MSKNFIIEPIENIGVEANYIVKDKNDNWFYLTNTKIEAEFLLDKFKDMGDEINMLKSTNMELEDYVGRCEEKLRKGLVKRYEYVCEQEMNHLDDVLLAKAYKIIKGEIISLADELGVGFEW